jgi:hypothetical protein
MEAGAFSVSFSAKPCWLEADQLFVASPMPYRILSIRLYRKRSQIQRGWLASDHKFSDECWAERHNFSDRRYGFSVDDQPSVTDSA